MTAAQLPLSAPAHRNQQLFSDYFLDHLLPQQTAWQALVNEAQTVRAQLQARYAAYTPSSNEAQLEQELVRPILQALGHTFEVQAALRTPDGTKKPDYVFYRDQATLLTNKNTTLTDALLQSGGLAVGDAKAWDRALDVALRTANPNADVFTNKNPSFQIAFYIQHSGVAWGILTNGRLWRLYHKDTAHKLDRFYEVDFPTLLADDQPERWLYFYAFFRRAAFDQGPLSIDAILHASREYARGVGDTLKAQVYDALRHLAQGFLDHPANNLHADPATLKTIYDHSLIVLYRLLFILYAEARDLLPLRTSPQYRDEYSLYAIKRRVADDLKYGRQLLPTSTRYWSQLGDLFTSIDQGNPPLKVATFNGGLFDARRYPFLETHRVGDARLQQAIDLLARVDGEFVDYRDLAERHLGTIYEGLLEYHLEPLPAAAPSSPFTIQLLNDKGERKATGSYYTPDYIVKYIVDHTVGPVLHAAVDGLTDDAAIIQAVLDVNVLDPAMGSGHFLVEATEYIARFLTDLGVKPTEETHGEADIAYWKRRVVQSCIYGVDLNPLAVDLAKLSLWLTTVAQDRPLSFLDHHLRTGNALVGAHIKDLQVGSSGAGAQRPKRKAKVTSTSQLSLLNEDIFRQSMITAVDSMRLIESSPGASVAEVKAQEQAYQGLRNTLARRYGGLADLVTATHFGLLIDATLWQPLADYATGRTTIPLPRFRQWVDEGERIAAERRFFHWELEFPEIFFNRHGQPLGEQAGFDAVIGNPPYIRQEELGPIKPYLAQQFAQMHHGVADLYVYFIAQGIQLLQHGGHFAYITSGTFRRLNFGAPLRRYLASQATITEIVEFGTQQIFSEAVTYPIILAVKKEPPQAHGTMNVKMFTASGRVTTVEASLPTGADPWVFTNASLQRVVRGWASSQPLSKVLSKPIYRGVTTGFNEAFVIDQATRGQLIQQDPASAHIIKPFLRGEDLRRWHEDVGKLWLIFARRGIDIDAYPAIKQHLEQYRSHLAPRPLNWDETQPWNGRKPGSYKWYEIQDSVDYFSVFEQPRIHSTKISLYPTFSLLTETAYAANTSYVLPVPDGATSYYVLSLLNSKVCAYYCRSVFAPKANGYYEVQPDGLAQFPVPIVAFTTPVEERERLADKGRRLYEQFCQKADYACVLGFVEHHLPRLPDGTLDTANEHSDVVHDLLAFLAKQMITLHKARQEAIEAFLLDVEGVLSKATLDNLGRLWTPPKAGSTPDAETTAMLGPLAQRRLTLHDDLGIINEEQWKWLVKRRLKKIDSLADLVRQYRKHQPLIAALDKQIAATDTLINQIVYRLYSLTDEDIAVVEGTRNTSQEHQQAPAA